MAEGKNKIVVYADWLDNFEHLTDEELGKLMRHFFMYVNDLNPVLEDRLLNVAWKPIEATLKRDLKKWESYIEKQKANGKKGGRPKTQKTQAFKNKPKKADSVSDSVSDRESNISNYEELLKFLILEIGKDKDYIKGMYDLYKLREGRLGQLATHFKSFCLTLPDQSKPKDLNHFRNFFTKWIKQQFDEGKYSHYTTKRLKGSL